MLEFKHLEEVLNRYGNELVESYKMGLLKNNSNASGNLVNSVKYEVSHNGNDYEVSLTLTDYWKYVEYGRRAGKWPPFSAIEKWIEIKPVIPRPMNGKLPTTKQLTYLIARKIGEEGIKPKNILKSSIEDVNSQFMESIYNALSEDLDGQMDEALIMLSKV